MFFIEHGCSCHQRSLGQSAYPSHRIIPVNEVGVFRHARSVNDMDLMRGCFESRLVVQSSLMWMIYTCKVLTRTLEMKNVPLKRGGEDGWLAPSNNTFSRH